MVRLAPLIFCAALIACQAEVSDGTQHTEPAGPSAPKGDVEPPFECTFGDALWAVDHIVAIRRRTITSTAEVTSLEREQLEQAWSERDRSAEEPILAVAENQQATFWDVADQSTGQVFRIVGAHLGDHSHGHTGAVFRMGSTEVVARLEEGDFRQCSVPRGEMAKECTTDADCASSLGCQQLDIGDRGRCVDRTPLAGEGQECTRRVHADYLTIEDSCPADAPLICDTRGEGLCRPVSARGTFAGADGGASVEPGETVEVRFDAFGLRSVPTDVELSLSAQANAQGRIRITLTSPDEGEYTVFDGMVSTRFFGIGAKDKFPFPTDESANGTWILRIENHTEGRFWTGTLNLTIQSRWD